MKTNKRYEKLPIGIIFLFIGISVAVLFGFLNANPAFASGTFKISQSETLDIRFISASTNDQGKMIDPGQDDHVGECSIIIDENYLDLRIYQGYPNYHCTLKVGVKNLSEHPVRLKEVLAKIPEELAVDQKDFHREIVLQPEEEITLAFRVGIKQTCDEHARYHFSVHFIFEDLNN